MASIQPHYSAAGAIALAEAQPPAEAENAEADTAAGGQAPAGAGGNGAHPWSPLVLSDLHPALRESAFGRDEGGDERPLLAQNAPQGTRNRATDAPTGLFAAAGVPGVQAQPASAPAAAAVPGKPIDLARMEALNTKVQAFRNPKNSLVSDADVRATKESFQKATDALRKGDYKTASQEFQKLGFPLPYSGGSQDPAGPAFVTAHVLGHPPLVEKGERQLTIDWGPHGHQATNDLDGFAANARMIERMSALPGGVSNPPTEAQAMQTMRDFAQPAAGQPPTAEKVMQAASELTSGSIAHYSVAGAQDPQYGLNPGLHAFYRGSDGAVHEFNSAAEAQAAAKRGDPPLGRGERVTTMNSRAPDAWSDITSQGTRAGRHIGDCESKLYLQTRLLTEAGFTSLGSVSVQPPGGGIGHMMGVFQAKDGSTWVTSNEDFRQVQGSGPNGAVTQADVDSTLRDMTAETYHVAEDAAGYRDTSGFRFSAAATANLTGPDAAVQSIRRADEMETMRRTETLVPPPPVQP